MFCLNVIPLTCVFVILTPVFSDVQNAEVHTDSENSVDTSKISEQVSEYGKRQLIAEKYLDTLEKVKEEWVDPYDMIGFSAKQLKEHLAVATTVSETSSKPAKINKVEADVPKCANSAKPLTDTTSTKSQTIETLIMPKENKETCALDSIYVTRWVKKLLYRIEKESDKESSAISFLMDSTMLENLKEISNAKSFEISTFDDIISSLVAQAVITRKEGFTWSRTYAYYADTLWLIIYGLSICAVVYALHQSFICRPKFTLACCGVVISVFWHWMHLYQQKKAHKHAELASMQIPTQCKKHDLGLVEHIHEYVKSFFAVNDCSKYYEALLIDPFWEVSFSMAISEAATSFVFQPLSASSRALNSFIKQLFDGLPFHLTVVLIIFIFIWTIMMCNYSFRLPFFMGRIEPNLYITGSRVEDVRQSASISSLRSQVRNVASSIQTASADSNGADGCASLPKAPKSSISKMIPGDDSQSNASEDHVETIPEDELAIQSGYFGTRKDDSKSAQSMFSDDEDNVNRKKISKKNVNTSILPLVTSPKKTSIDNSSEEGVQSNVNNHVNSLETTEDVLGLIPIPSQRNDAHSNVDVDNRPEVSNLPGSLSDSFEVLPLPSDDNNIETSFNGNFRAGPNCDTSRDILQEMHAGCINCN